MRIDGTPIAAALQQYGAATWGNTREEAFKHIQAVVEMVIEEVRGRHSHSERPEDEVEVFVDERVAVTV